MKYGFQLCREWKDSALPDGLVEIKYDGIMGIAEDGDLYNRRGNVMSHKYPEIIPNADLVLVGEVVIFNKDNVSDFHAAQSRTQNEKENMVRAKRQQAFFMVFDLLEANGKSYVDMPQIERKKLLKAHENELGANVKMIDYVPLKYLDEAIKMSRENNLEGLIIKSLDAPYYWNAKSKSSRPPHWFKLVPWYDVVVPIDSYEETGVGKGFVLYITTPQGYKQKVVCNSIKMRSRVESGEAKWVKVKYKSVEMPSGAFRQPSTVEVYSYQHKSSRELD